MQLNFYKKILWITCIKCGDEPVLLSKQAKRECASQVEYLPDTHSIRLHFDMDPKEAEGIIEEIKKSGYRHKNGAIGLSRIQKDSYKIYDFLQGGRVSTVVLIKLAVCLKHIGVRNEKVLFSEKFRDKTHFPASNVVKLLHVQGFNTVLCVNPFIKKLNESATIIIQNIPNMYAIHLFCTSISDITERNKMLKNTKMNMYKFNNLELPFRSVYVPFFKNGLSWSPRANQPEDSDEIYGFSSISRKNENGTAVRNMCFTLFARLESNSKIDLLYQRFDELFLEMTQGSSLEGIQILHTFAPQLQYVDPKPFLEPW